MLDQRLRAFDSCLLGHTRLFLLVIMLAPRMIAGLKEYDDFEDIPIIFADIIPEEYHEALYEHGRRELWFGQIDGGDHHVRTQKQPRTVVYPSIDLISTSYSLDSLDFVRCQPPQHPERKQCSNYIVALDTVDPWRASLICS